jgi:O-antigen biosynthesis protein
MPLTGFEALRRAQAPRLIDWTGERMVPWAPDVPVVYEHLHRYSFATEAVAGRRVLDVGSGEGYGSALLATVAESVVGIDIDERTIEHSRANYAAANLEFRLGSALDLSPFADGEFGAVVCFEVIEHVAEQEQLLDQIARVLADDGLLICSTPERLTYADLSESDNPFHVRELTREEFHALLEPRLPQIAMWGQRTITGSALYPVSGVDGAGGAGGFIEREAGTWRPAAAPVPLYLVAIASRQPVSGAAFSYLADPGLALMRDEELVSERLRGELTQAQERVNELEDAEARAAGLEDAQARLAVLAVSQSENAVRAEVAEAELRKAAPRLARMDASVTWHLLERMRGVLTRPDGKRTGLGRVVSLALRLVGRRMRSDDGRPLGGDSPSAGWPIRFPEFAQPVVSIVVPIHDQAAATERCLRSILHNTDAPTYEVIVVDDASKEPATSALLGRVSGAHGYRNDENLGFLHSANRGADAARGQYVVFLNNDTEVREGWLSALVEAAAPEDVGVVAAKLILPDYTLQEAGGIVWRDGSARHVGRGRSPEDPAYEYLREVDYGSGACLLVKSRLLKDLGGFDERYVPAYYEDTDLCFEARARGLRVVYQPRAEVVHHEGTSHGTDETQGVKAYQVRNAKIFASKWSDVLEREQLDPDFERIHFAMDRRRTPHVLVVDHKVPTTREDSGSVRMHEMILTLRELGARVTLMPDNRVKVEPYTAELQAHGVEVLYGGYEERDIIEMLGADLSLAILSRPTVAWRYLHILREYAPQARILYDTVDLHYVREGRRADSSDISQSAAIRDVADTFRELELGLIRSCDETIAVSEEERATILAELPDTRVSVIPNIHRVAARVPPAASRRGLMFLGGFYHRPNVGAAVHLVRELLPRIRELAGPLPVAIVGTNPPPVVEELAEVDGVEVTGFVEDLRPYFDRYRVMAAPLLYGAGVKGKVTQSLAAGLPVVTTPVGAEGLGAESGVHLMVAEDDASFAAAVAEVCRDDALWERLSAQGRELAGERFAPQVAQRELGRMLEDAQRTESLTRS